MSSWGKRSNPQLPTQGIYTTYESEDNQFIYLNFVRNTTSYPDSDIAYIIRKTNDYYLANVETITRDNSFSPYVLHINNSKFNIKSPNESIRLITLAERKIINPRTNIPKTLIHTWNTKEIENTDLYYPVKVLKTLHPDYNYVIFDEEERKNFIKNNYDERVLNAYNKLKPGTYKADLWRYCYLYKNGGFYMDIKFVMRKSFNAIINENIKLLTGKAMYTDGINPGFTACLPNEPLMKAAIDTTVDRIEKNYYGISSLDITGPLMFEYAFTNTYGLSSSEYIDRQNQQIVMGRYNDINNFNCILFNNSILAHNGFSTYYSNHRTSPYVVFWNNKDVYHLE